MAFYRSDQVEIPSIAARLGVTVFENVVVRIIPKVVKVTAVSFREVEVKPHTDAGKERADCRSLRSCAVRRLLRILTFYALDGVAKAIVVNTVSVDLHRAIVVIGSPVTRLSVVVTRQIDNPVEVKADACQTVVFLADRAVEASSVLRTKLKLSLDRLPIKSAKDHHLVDVPSRLEQLTEQRLEQALEQWQTFLEEIYWH